MAHRGDGLNDIFEHNVIIRDNLKTKGGTIEQTPTNNKDIVNKEYCDSQSIPLPLSHTNSSQISNVGTNTHAQIDSNLQKFKITEEDDAADYFTNKVDSGEGIDFSYNSTTDVLTILGEDATTTNKGIASFNTNDFSVSSGAVSIKDSGIEAFPVGSVFLAVVSTNPATLLGYGTWSAFGAGKVLVGLDSGDADFDTAEETGGTKTHTHGKGSYAADSHTLTTAEMPSHTHDVNTIAGSSPGSNNILRSIGNTGIVRITSLATGGGGGHTHAVSGTSDSGSSLQPYIVVYMWKRTA